nr:unnamed protein product [Digitaria exilis]
MSSPTEGASYSWEKKQRRTTTPTTAGSCAASDGVDLISGLGDDVLVRILELLPDTRDAVRTHALSRRWRGLWTRVPALRFASDEPEFFTDAGAGERHLAFVDAALALRAAHTAPAVEHLAVTFKMKHGRTEERKRLTRGDQEIERLVPRAAEAVAGWIRYAAQHGLKSVAVELRLPARAYIRHGGFGYPVMLLHGLPSSTKLETMRLDLGGAVVCPPTAAQFASLTDLSIEHVVVADVEIGGYFARLLSSACCPSLKKLRLADLALGGPNELLVEVDELSELWIERN